MSTARKASGVVLVFLGMLGYGGVAGAEYVMRDAPIPIAMLAPSGVLLWLGICWVLASKEREFTAWLVVLSGGILTLIAAGFIIAGLPEEKVTPLIAVILFLHLLFMLWKVRSTESRLL